MGKSNHKKTVKRRRLRLKKEVFIVGGLIVIAILAGLIFFLSGDKKKNTKDKTEDTTTVAPAKKLSIVDVNDNLRPFAVMINNVGVARPLQSGLQDAMIIYEMIVEGGITRYMAVFNQYATTERIGSIRSSRHYYLDYALENDAIYVHHGQSPQAASDFGALGIDRIVADNGNTGWRDKSLNVSSEHTLFTSIAKLKNGIGKKRTERNKDLLLNYSVDSIDMASIPNAKAANNVKIVYSNIVTDTYDYDAEAKVYKRSVNSKAHTDYVTGKQYTFKNIIVYQVANSTLNDGEGKGRQTLSNIGNGTGYFISEGYAIPITWEKSSRGAQTIYRYENGEKLQVNDGNTFIQIQPKNKEISIN